MTRVRTACRAVALLALAGWCTAAAALEPFVAQYDVLRGGRTLGAATMQLTRTAPQRWRIDLTMRGTGLLRVAGINAEQSTVFETDGETFRPLTQSTVRSHVFTRRQSTGVYDWARLRAQWRGDVKKSRQAPVALQPGDMSGLLINLAVIRDAQPGRSFAYRFVDDGRARVHRYVVAAEPEPVHVGDMAFDALRVTRVQDGGDETVIWVVDGVPTPVRLLQRENGQDTYDLRLTEYKGID